MEQTSKKSICGIFDHDVQTESVKISELHDFQGHPFKVEHDMQLFELSKSIEEKGVLVPLIVKDQTQQDQGMKSLQGTEEKQPANGQAQIRFL